MYNDNLCEDIRKYLKERATVSGIEFTTKELGMAMGLLKPSQVGSKSNSRMETKIGDELRRLRHKKCKGRKRTNDTSQHVEMANKAGFKVSVESYKCKNSKGGRRPAILWKVTKLQDRLDAFMDLSPSTVIKTPITPMFDLSKVPSQELIQELSKRIT